MFVLEKDLEISRDKFHVVIIWYRLKMIYIPYVPCISTMRLNVSVTNVSGLESSWTPVKWNSSLHVKFKLKI